MNRSASDLRADALAIWHAGLAAVRSDHLVRENVQIDGDYLLIGDPTQARSASKGYPPSTTDPLAIPLSPIHRIAVVGAGKAGAGMAAGLIEALGPQILADKQLHGWLNVPADCVSTVVGTLRVPSLHGEQTGGNGTRSVPSTPIHLHPARPPGLNEPTAEGVLGGEKILEIVSSLGPNDLCFCLLSGGGSALMPAPVEGVSLAEKQALTRHLSAAGANIEELNTVRKQLSRIKGGRLARACRAGRLITLIISDVLGDPLDVIASGPTVQNSTTPADALAILERYNAATANLRHVLQHSALRNPHSALAATTNLVIGNNALAVDAAGIEAERRGYSHAMSAATTLEGPAEDIGRHLAQMAIQMQSQPGPDCLITGGEPTVKLAPPEIRGRGGRNQQLVLAALVEWLNADCGLRNAESRPNEPAFTPHSALRTPQFCLLSAGTDGEDGPTDAAGAILDSHTIARMRAQNLDPADFLRRNDAYTFFQATESLIQTGPTHTNVCDVRVAVVSRAANR